MENQTQTAGRINPAFTGPQDEQDHLEKSRMGQSEPPPYYPNTTGFQFPRVYPNSSGYPIQPYGAPVGPQGPYVQQSFLGKAVYPQEPYVGQTGVTVQPTVVVTPVLMAAPDYLGYSIFTLLCCCLPLGIATVIYSSYTRDANLSGQRELAMSSSRTAFILNNVALGVGLTLTAASIIIIIFAARWSTELTASLFAERRTDA